MKHPAIASLLSQIDPFSILSADVVSEVAGQVFPRNFEAKELIFLEQTEGDAGYVIVQGRVALLKTSPSGKELIVELLGAGELFGIVVLLDRQVYPLTARAQVPTTVISFGRHLIQPLVKSHPELHHGFTSLLSRRLHTSHNLARALAHDKVEVRVASVLSALVLKNDQDASISIGRQELADLCGITIETASRVMKGFEKDGLVDLSALGSVTVLNKSILRQVAEGS